MKASMANDLEAGRPLDWDLGWWGRWSHLAVSMMYVPRPRRKFMAPLKPYRAGLIR